MLKTILGILSAAVLIFLVIVARKPSHFRVERSITVGTQAAIVFDNVNDFHKWEAWSPWAKLDPNAKLVFDGPSSGTGAGFSWNGNRQVGEGRMIIVESHAPEFIRYKLEFTKPFQATNVAEFFFKADGPTTRVTWAMEGDNSFIYKAVGLFMNCDKMIGGEFEKGLRDLKIITEASGNK